VPSHRVLLLTEPTPRTWWPTPSPGRSRSGPSTHRRARCSRATRRHRTRPNWRSTSASCPGTSAPSLTSTLMRRSWEGRRDERSDGALESTIKAAYKEPHKPTIAARARELSDAAIRNKQTFSRISGRCSQQSSTTALSGAGLGGPAMRSFRLKRSEDFRFQDASRSAPRTSTSSGPDLLCLSSGDIALRQVRLHLTVDEVREVALEARMASFLDFPSICRRAM
jgi:hypothetical protein